MYGFKKIESGCHITLAVLRTHSTPRAMNKHGFLSALQIAHALIFLAADTTPDFFKDHIQYCAGKCETSPPKGAGGGIV